MNSEEEETYEGKLLQLEEVKKTKPSKRKVASLMKDTFTKRRDWISKDLPTVEEVITKFPPLKKARTVSQEICNCDINFVLFVSEHYVAVE